MKKIVTVLAILTICASQYANADAREDLKAVIDAHWQFELASDPIQASQVGLRKFDAMLPDATPRALAKRTATKKVLLARLAGIDDQLLTQQEQVNKELLSWVLSQSIAGDKHDTARIPFNTFSGFFRSALHAHDGLNMRTISDYEAYIARLNEFPRFFSENIDNMRRGIKTDMVLPKIIIDGVAPTVRSQINPDIQASSLYKHFVNMPAQISDKDQTRLRSDGMKAIKQSVYPALEALADFLEGEYYAAASDSIGISARPGGDDYYAHQISEYVTLTDLGAQDIHNIGLAEVGRIRKEMQTLIDGLKFDGDFAEFTAFLRSSPEFYADSAEDLLKAAAYTAKRIDHVMPAFFGVLPRMPYGVVPVPDAIAPNYTTASYSSAAVGGTRGGEYWVNTYKLDQRPLYELTALTLHEAVPGHHHQAALAQEATGIPPFRRQLYFSAFGEGWALYSEKLGVEMGVYQSDYENFGRLSYEMWRACRLVIDTGIHAKGWSRQQAQDYLSANTSLSQANVRAEVDRYISWPGQALSYKIGELKIWELRRKAEAALGDDFDLREFHDRVLKNGALPLALLEAELGRYIDRQP